MRSIIIVTSLAIGLVACASNSPPAEEGPGLKLTPKARKMVMEQGSATAVERGYAEETDLVCETRKKLGSHMVERVCYTRAEGAQLRRATQEALRAMQRGDSRQPTPPM